MNEKVEEHELKLKSPDLIPISSKLKNVLINEEKLFKLLKDTEISDDVSNWFAETILKNKFFMGLTIFFNIYIFHLFNISNYLQLCKKFNV